VLFTCGAINVPSPKSQHPVPVTLPATMPPDHKKKPTQGIGGFSSTKPTHSSISTCTSSLATAGSNHRPEVRIQSLATASQNRLNHNDHHHHHHPPPPSTTNNSCSSGGSQQQQPATVSSATTTTTTTTTTERRPPKKAEGTAQRARAAAHHHQQRQRRRRRRQRRRRRRCGSCLLHH